MAKPNWFDNFKEDDLIGALLATPKAVDAMPPLLPQSAPVQPQSAAS